MKLTNYQFLITFLIFIITTSSFGMLTLKERAMELIDDTAYKQADIPQELNDEIPSFKQALGLKKNLLLKNLNNNKKYEVSIFNIISNMNIDPKIAEKSIDLLIREGKIENPIAITLGDHTFLSWAAKLNNIPAIQLLCNKYKAPVNEKIKGMPPLFWASGGTNSPDTIQTLLQLGATDINFQDDDGRTLLHWSSPYFPHEIDILVQAGADINAQEKKGNTPLMYYIQKAPLNAKKILSYSGHNFAIANSDGKTALDLAKESNDPELISLIEEARKKQTIISKRSETSHLKKGFNL